MIKILIYVYIYICNLSNKKQLIQVTGTLQKADTKLVATLHIEEEYKIALFEQF